jgi:hypothetical protein
MSLVLQTRLTKFETKCRRNEGVPAQWPHGLPPVQSDQSDTDPREKSESRAGIPPFQVNAER